jgi:hypothetical protein
VCYLPDENEEKKPAEEGFRRMEAELAALPDAHAAEALELLARLKKIQCEIDAIWGAMPRVEEPPQYRLSSKKMWQDSRNYWRRALKHKKRWTCS